MEEPVPLLEAAGAGDILLVLTTDESMPFIWDEQIAPGIEAGNTLCWGSGYNVGYKVISPPAEADAIMIAPIMMGNIVRERYEAGGRGGRAVRGGAGRHRHRARDGDGAVQGDGA